MTRITLPVASGIGASSPTTIRNFWPSGVTVNFGLLGSVYPPALLREGTNSVGFPGGVGIHRPQPELPFPLGKSTNDQHATIRRERDPTRAVQTLNSTETATSTFGYFKDADYSGYTYSRWSMEAPTGRSGPMAERSNSDEARAARKKLEDRRVRIGFRDSNVCQPGRRQTNL
jgi:hypothetical protein